MNNKRQEKIERRKRQKQAKEQSTQQRQFAQKMFGIGGTVVGIFVIFLLWTNGVIGGERDPHKFDEFAACLTEADLVMYGTDWCPHCQDQKQMFGDAFDLIEYYNCDFNQALCDAKGVEGYPTWHVGSDFFGTGVQTFYDFADASGCELPEGF